MINKIMIVLGLFLMSGCAQPTHWCNSEHQCTRHFTVVNGRRVPCYDDTKPHSNGITAVYPQQK